MYLAWCKEGESDAVLQLCWQNLDACRKQDDPIHIIWALNDLAAPVANPPLKNFLLQNLAYALFLTRDFSHAHTISAPEFQ